MNKFRYIKYFLLILASLFGGLRAFGQLDTEKVLTIGRNALYFEDYLLSIQYFNQVIKTKPYLAEPYFFRGLAKYYLEDYQGAEADCSLAIEKNPFLVDAYELRGLSRLSLGRFDAAVADYDFGLRYYPENRIFLLNKAIAQQNGKDYEAARQTFDLLLGKFPRYDKGYLGRSHLNLVEKDSLAALADAERCLEVNENNIDAYLIRADIRLNRDKDYAAALEDVNQAIRLEPKRAGLFINRAFLKYNTDDYFGAMADFDYAIGLDPTNVAAHFNRGLLKMEVQDNNKAIEDFSFVIEREPDNYKALYNRAVLYQEVRQYKKSIEDFTKVLDAYPYLSSVYFARSESRRLSGDMKGGEADYKTFRRLQAKHEERKHHVAESDATNEETSAEESPEEVIKRFSSLMTVENEKIQKPEYDNKYRGKVQNYDIAVNIEGMYVLSYYDRSKTLRADAYYQREIDEINSSYYLRDKLYVTNAEAHLSEAEIETQFGLIRHYSSLLASTTPRAVDYFGRGLSYMLVKNYTAAIDDFSKSVELSPHFTLAYFARANARYFEMVARKADSGDAEDSSRMLEQMEMKLVVADFDKVVSLSPKLVYAHFNKGNIYYSQGDYTSAISCYTNALSVKADFGEAYYNRGIAYFRMGNVDKGMADLSRAGELGIMSSYNVIKRMRRNLN